MKKQLICVLLTAILCCMLLPGCGAKNTAPAEAAPAAPAAAEETLSPVQEEEVVEEEPAPAPVEDGVYVASFKSDGSMFHVNEMMHGTVILTVENGKMMAHLVMPSKNVLHLFPGLAEDAKAEGAVLLDPTTEAVTYDDGLTENVFAFDVPVPVLDEEFDLAIIGKKEVWYDHKVVISVIEPWHEPLVLEDGEYSVEATLEGGSGRAFITSPVVLTAVEGSVTARIEMSSSHYDYMIVAGEKYLPLEGEGNSVFEIPVTTIEVPLAVIADTTAMSQPHEVEYEIVFDANTLK